MAIRSGRFNFPNQTAASKAPHVIVKLSKGAKSVAFYRVLNSGQHDFTLKVLDKDAKEKVTKDLEPDDSMDVAVDDEGSVEITWAVPPNSEIKDVSGIYNFLGDKDSNSLEDVRSGRYTGKPGDGQSGNPGDGQIFVDYAASDKATAVYRIYNSGKAALSIYKATPTTDLKNKIADLNSKFSIDISPEEGGKLFVVAATDDTEVDMIYEFLAGALKS